jgi:hypothetical protein
LGAHVKYLYRSGDDTCFAYAPGRRDFFRCSDDTLWAHESSDWLIAARTGEILAHRTRRVYYSIDAGVPLFYEPTEPSPETPASARTVGPLPATLRIAGRRD